MACLPVQGVGVVPVGWHVPWLQFNSSYLRRTFSYTNYLCIYVLIYGWCIFPFSFSGLGMRRLYISLRLGMGAK